MSKVSSELAYSCRKGGHLLLLVISIAHCAAKVISIRYNVVTISSTVILKNEGFFAWGEQRENIINIRDGS